MRYLRTPRDERTERRGRTSEGTVGEPRTGMGPPEPARGRVDGLCTAAALDETRQPRTAASLRLCQRDRAPAERKKHWTRAHRTSSNRKIGGLPSTARIIRRRRLSDAVPRRYDLCGLPPPAVCRARCISPSLTRRTREQLQASRLATAGARRTGRSFAWADARVQNATKASAAAADRGQDALQVLALRVRRRGPPAARSLAVRAGEESAGELAGFWRTSVARAARFFLPACLVRTPGRGRAQAAGSRFGQRSGQNKNERAEERDDGGRGKSCEEGKSTPDHGQRSRRSPPAGPASSGRPLDAGDVMRTDSDMATDRPTLVSVSVCVRPRTRLCDWGESCTYITGCIISPALPLRQSRGKSATRICHPATASRAASGAAPRLFLSIRGQGFPFSLSSYSPFSNNDGFQPTIAPLLSAPGTGLVSIGGVLGVGPLVSRSSRQQCGILVSHLSPGNIH